MSVVLDATDATPVDEFSEDTPLEESLAEGYSIEVDQDPTVGLTVDEDIAQYEQGEAEVEEDATEEEAQVEEEVPAVPPVDEALQKDAEALRAFQKQFASDPKGTIEEMMRIAGMNSDAITPPADEFTGVDPQDLTPVESFVYQNRDFLKKAPQAIDTIRQRQNETHAYTQWATAIQNETAMAIADAIGFTIPDPTTILPKILEETNKGKTIQEAIKAHYAPLLKQEVTRVKQSKAPVPKTPKPQTTAVPRPVSKDGRMLTIREILAYENSHRK